MMPASELRSTLGGFTGTDGYHRLTLSKRIVATDGVTFLAKEANCFWLMDAIASHQPACMKDEMLQGIQFWTLKVNADKSAELVCERDIGDVFLTQKIPYTDFPLESIKLYVEAGEAEGRPVMVAMLPSER
jgi:hypothetical protein